MRARINNMTGQVSEFASAKINLCLHVTGLRKDGYHLLDSLVAFADVGDELTIRAAAQTTLSVRGPFANALDNQPDNLILRAVRVLGLRGSGVEIELIKRLPVASGIGGGSADAAATLRALILLDQSESHLANQAGRLALELGADVPACLISRALRMSGIGEVIEEVAPLPEVPAILVNPLIQVPTGQVFAGLKIAPGSNAGARLAGLPASGFCSVGDLAMWLTEQRNDLQPTAMALVPEVRVVLEAIDAQGGCLMGRMSGSGPTCFGLFENQESAEDAANSIARSNPDWWAVRTSLS